MKRLKKNKELSNSKNMCYIMNYLNFAKYLLAIAFMSLCLACSGSNKGESNNQEVDGARTASSSGALQGDKQLNVSIFLDLSARLMPSQENPEPRTRDIEAIKSIVEIFKNDMASRGAYKAKGRIKVFFNPIPEDDEINKLATDLSVNLGGLDTKGKKAVYDKISAQFEDAIGRIYDRSLESKRWIGADIWRFFKKDVKEHCMLDGYRNIVVLLTDGYIYHERSKLKDGNRYSYLLGPLFQEQGLRRTSQWREVIENNDFGLITPQSGLEDLEVLILELCPENNHPQDEDILEYLLEKWLREMGVGSYKIHSTDLPINTKESIKRFFLG